MGDRNIRTILPGNCLNAFMDPTFLGYMKVYVNSHINNRNDDVPSSDIIAFIRIELMLFLTNCRWLNGEWIEELSTSVFPCKSKWVVSGVVVLIIPLKRFTINMEERQQCPVQSVVFLFAYDQDTMGRAASICFIRLKHYLTHAAMRHDAWKWRSALVPGDVFHHRIVRNRTQKKKATSTEEEGNQVAQSSPSTADMVAGSAERRMVPSFASRNENDSDDYTPGSSSSCNDDDGRSRKLFQYPRSKRTRRSVSSWSKVVLSIKLETAAMLIMVIRFNIKN